MSEQLTDVDQLAAKECDEAFVKLVAILQTSAYSAGASGGNVGLDTMSSSRAAIIDCYGQLERKLDTCGLQCSATMKSLVAENERLRTALTGISTCSTCEVCRGAATLALGAPSTTEATPSSPDTFEGTFGNVLSGTCSKCYRASHVLSQQHGVCPECFSTTGDGP